VELRAAVQVDAPVLAEIHVRSWQAAYRGIIPDDYLDSLSIPAREGAWIQILQEAPSIGQATFLVEIEGEPVGFVGLTPSRDADATSTTGEVAAIYLVPEVWDRGVGRLLMGRAVEWLQEAGFTSATLWVLTDNVRARRFYEAGGWRADGTERLDDRGSFVLTETRYTRAL